MSIGTIATIIKRIEGAKAISPIAVFIKEGALDAVFADTYKTQERIKDGDINYIGTFNRTMNMADIRKQLRLALNNQETGNE